MNRTLLSEMLALATFIASFWPLARRAGPHTRIWLLGWMFVLAENVALLLATGGPVRQHLARLAALWAAELCGLCFIRGGGNAPVPPIGWIFLLEMGVPTLFQSTLFVFGVRSFPVNLIAALFLFAPAVHMLAWPEDRTRPLIHLSGAFAFLATLSVALAEASPASAALASSVLSNGILCVLFSSAASLYFEGAVRVTRGIAVAAIGLIAWGLSYPMALLFAQRHPPVTLDRALLDLPLYCVAYGMILTLLEEHLGRTEQLALADPLTGLSNTRHFEDRFTTALASSTLHGNPIACLVIDVDDFKQVNDNFGHPVGDDLLKALAVRLAWHIGPRDTLARTGGDEFTALLVGESDESHLHFIARAMMSAACVPISLQGQSIAVKVSIGIAISGPDTPNLAALRKAADDAMYEAKRGGGGLLTFAGQPSRTSAPAPATPSRPGRLRVVFPREKLPSFEALDL